MPRLGGFPQGNPTDPDDLPTLIEELRELLTGRDLTQLVNSVVVPAMAVAHSGSESLADGDTTSSWAAKVEYLVGVALSVDPAGDADTPPEVTNRVRQLVSEIFDGEQMRMIIASLENADGDNGERDLLLQQLRLEYQADRMPGYAVHLEHVDAEVFGPHRDYYINGLGFDPGDVIRVTRRHARWVNQAFISSLDALTESLNSDAPNPEAAAAWLSALNAATLWNPDDVAACTGVPVEQITAMLDFFSTEFGCQPEFRAPGDPNRARTHPCIKLTDGTYFVPDRWSLSAVIHHRLAVETERNGFNPQKYYKHRQDAHERLVAGALEKVFGASHVYSSMHYDLASGEHGEIDSLACTEWPLVVEAKAIALTEAGRRGLPRRVDTKLKDILGKALDQTNRALTYILNEGGRSFAATENGKPIQLLPDDVSGGTAIIVTFERIDPFASGGLAVAGNVNRPTWVVSLTDLLMVTDILENPAAFHHYAQTRAGMHSAEASAAAEADALGAYLIDRLRIIDQSSSEEPARIFIGYSCAELNDFYTRQEVGLEGRKPVTGVPEEIANALTNTFGQPGWVACVNAVMTADPSAWPKWGRFRSRRRRNRTFALNDDVSLVALSEGNSSLECLGASIKLNVASGR
ncbi:MULTISPECIES: hypothetical protein [Mycolicibacterium]|uniref:hypothetical protein n=1 Tax=Mycolicibacterium TaxID=1866885 RepID=UPI0007EB2FFE|nr:hypothetical protein [Mycolicibacterium fortuitum]MDG5768376.1 hypothetical protein [Mycolicibacterium fortuitum]MDG5781166.1 hypothetical protein [Mycolicibacterium fortuitum]NOP97108.1 hypothetical protein [Mycolicibacterium fortuitum]OBB30516.1 hypothetical protein A5763_13485 [Mycolicibacterium fortuitum]OBB51459.1 hypothetical protein A5754_24035 [Mycolicibacterium fortuitum]